jgi:hypothetical protein
VGSLTDWVRTRTDLSLIARQYWAASDMDGNGYEESAYWKRGIS